MTDNFSGSKELQVINKDGQFVVDSRDVADMLGKRHADLLETIDNYVQVLENGNIRSQDFFIESSYKTDSNNKNYKMYLLTRKGCDMVANKTTGKKGILFTATYVSRFEEMEKQLQNVNTFKIPQTLSEALRLAADLQEEKEQLKIENKYKSDVIVGLVEDISLADKRQILNQVVRCAGGKKTGERWGLLYKHFDMKEHVNSKYQYTKYNKEHSPKLTSQLDYVDKIMNKIPEMYDIACKLFENDVEKLKAQLYAANQKEE